MAVTKDSSPGNTRLRDRLLAHPFWTVISALAAIAGVVVPFIVTAEPAPDKGPAPASVGASASPVPAALSTPSASPSATRSPGAAVSPAPGGGGGNPPPTTARAPYTGSLEVDEGTYIDWDTTPPSAQPKGSSLPPTVDVQIGPDNAYPENMTRMWQTDSPDTCAAQAASNGSTGLQRQVQLHLALRPQPGFSVDICMVTTYNRVGLLTISSINDNTYSPYRIRYRF